jgi:hypothetical protein
MNYSAPDATYMMLLLMKSSSTYATYHGWKSPANAWSIMAVTSPLRFGHRSAYETHIPHLGALRHFTFK